MLTRPHLEDVSLYLSDVSHFLYSAPAASAPFWSPNVPGERSHQGLCTGYSFCWDALSLDMQIPCSLTSQPPPGLCSKLTSHVRFYNLFPCLLLCCTCHHLRHLISCLLSPSQNCMHCEGRNPVCLCIAVFSVPREDVTHKKWMFSEWMEGRVQEAE